MVIPGGHAPPGPLDRSAPLQWSSGESRFNRILSPDGGTCLVLAPASLSPPPAPHHFPRLQIRFYSSCASPNGFTDGYFFR